MYYLAEYKQGFDSAWDDLLEGAEELGINLAHITEDDAHELLVQDIQHRSVIATRANCLLE